MANVYAVKSGNWSDTTVWNTGTLPTVNDTVYANTYTVTIDVSPTVQAISNASASGISATGYFKPANGITLTCTAEAGIIGGWNGNRAPLLFDLNAGSSANVVATLAAAGYAVAGASLVGIAGTGTLNVTGNITGGADGTQTRAVYFTAAGILNATGVITGGAWSDGTSNAIFMGATAGTVNINGSAVAQTAAAVQSTGASTITLNGAATASSSSAAITSSSLSAATSVTGPLYNTSGVMAVYAQRLYFTASATSWRFTTTNLAVDRTLYTADSVGGNPAASNVRYGTTYGPANELTGTAHIPAAASVLYGVPVDATTGTATVSAADIRSAIGLASANLDTQLDALPTASENATAVWGAGTRTLTSAAGITAQDVWEYATRTLTAGSGITAQDVWEYATREITGGTVDTLTNSPDVPTESEIAAQVRVELTPELARVANCATVESTGDQLAGLL